MAASILEPLPAPVEEKIEELLGAEEAPRIAAGTDIDPEGRFQGAWLVATDRRLLIVASEPKRGAERPAAESPQGRRRLLRGWPAARARARRPFPRRRSSAPETLLPEDGMATLDPQALTVLQIPLETVSAVSTRDYVGN